ncbi:MAG TPA: type VI secretion system membrane subunit TssM, partial [Amaricoccus sp.]|nr:type VI secretion system membrane subunit TssM [Amaricoccus sp.]
MAVLRFIWAVFTSRWLWSLIGIALLGAIVWMFGPLVAIGTARPLAGDIARLGVILAFVLIWLVWIILAQRRAIRANRLFVSELVVPEAKPFDPSAEGVAAVGAKFQEIMAELKKRKLGGRRFLRDMPWYVIIGPPASGKTTALRQSGLEFPFDLTDDLQGVGGTRNCDWFFTETAVMIDTAGRYVQQESQPEVDAAEWTGFLDLLKKHRGRKALNGVIVAISAEILAEGDASIRAHGREIRKRLAELNQRLEIRLPVYLLVTKCDLVKGFEPSFEGLSSAEREQVWGATFAPGEKADGSAVGRELAALVERLEGRVGPRMEGEEALSLRAEIFRFPAQVASLEAPLRLLVDTVFGESRYEESAWLRGFYLTSATQEGAPIDRMVGALSSAFGLPVAHAQAAPRIERRSFFLRRFLTDVVFAEAGLASLDPKAELRRLWLWR